MSAPQGARFAIAFTGDQPWAEDLREQNKDVLFFVDNIYAFRAGRGRNIHAAWGRVPSESRGIRRLWLQMSESCMSESARRRPVPSLQLRRCIFRPMTMTDPAVVAISSFLNAQLFLLARK